MRCTLRALRPCHARSATARRAALLLALAGCGARPQRADRISARVTRHTDGDTLWLSGIGKVRLIGVDTPEVYGEVECYGRQASAFVRRLLPLGSRVRYSLDVDERDRYGRALAYVYTADGRFLNLLLVRRGYAQPLTIPPNDRFAGALCRRRAPGPRARRGPVGARGLRVGSPACCAT